MFLHLPRLGYWFLQPSVLEKPWTGIKIEKQPLLIYYWIITFVFFVFFFFCILEEMSAGPDAIPTQKAASASRVEDVQHQPVQ